MHENSASHNIRLRHSLCQLPTDWEWFCFPDRKPYISHTRPSHFPAPFLHVDHSSPNVTSLSNPPELHPTSIRRSVFVDLPWSLWWWSCSLRQNLASRDLVRPNSTFSPKMYYRNMPSWTWHLSPTNDNPNSPSVIFVIQPPSFTSPNYFLCHNSQSLTQILHWLC